MPANLFGIRSTAFTAPGAKHAELDVRVEAPTIEISADSEAALNEAPGWVHRDDVVNVDEGRHGGITLLVTWCLAEMLMNNNSPN